MALPVGHAGLHGAPAGAGHAQHGVAACMRVCARRRTWALPSHGPACTHIGLPAPRHPAGPHLCAGRACWRAAGCEARRHGRCWLAPMAPRGAVAVTRTGPCQPILRRRRQQGGGGGARVCGRARLHARLHGPARPASPAIALHRPACTHIGAWHLWGGRTLLACCGGGWLSVHALSALALCCATLYTRCLAAWPAGAHSSCARRLRMSPPALPSGHLGQCNVAPAGGALCCCHQALSWPAPRAASCKSHCWWARGRGGERVHAGRALGVSTGNDAALAPSSQTRTLDAPRT